MKQTILITIILLSAIGSQAQYLTTNQKNQVASMITTATKPLISDIAILKSQVKLLQDSLAVFKNGMVKSNTMNFKYPLNGMKDPILPNTFNVTFDTLYLKR